MWASILYKHFHDEIIFIFYFCHLIIFFWWEPNWWFPPILWHSIVIPIIFKFSLPVMMYTQLPSISRHAYSCFILQYLISLKVIITCILNCWSLCSTHSSSNRLFYLSLFFFFFFLTIWLLGLWFSSTGGISYLDWQYIHSLGFQSSLFSGFDPVPEDINPFLRLEHCSSLKAFIFQQ